MNVLDLFSGIGGFSLGLQRAGMKTIGFCEIDKYCQKVLKKNFPDIPIYDDVCKLTGSDINEPVDLICGGFPCQPFSVAGKRLGAADDRHLWPEYLRLIQELRPTWVIGENVAGLINMGLDNVLSNLEGAGYSSRTFVIPAVAVDAKHRRDRLWIVAHSNLQHDQRRGQPCKPISVGRETRTELNGGRSNVAHTHGAHGEGNECTKRSIPQRANFSQPCRWEPEPSVGRVAHGIPHRMDRLKGLGNAVVPQIPEIIGNAIMEVSRS